jgi:hypothetical protein
MRTSLLVTWSLLIGFAAGWFAHARMESPSPATPPPQRQIASPATDNTALPAKPSATTGTATQKPDDPIGRRTQAIRELSRLGLNSQIAAFSGDKFSPQLGKALSLTPDESSRLALAAQEAKRAIDAARLARASSRVSEDGKTLIVESPSVDVAASRAIYDRLLDTVKSTLDRERFELFNELTGDSFDRGFEQFGLQSYRYEMELTPILIPERAGDHLNFKRHILNYNGVSVGWSGSRLNYPGIEKHAPVLAHFIPSELRPKQQP